jgi:hypothetical protein
MIRLYLLLLAFVILTSCDSRQKLRVEKGYAAAEEGVEEQVFLTTQVQLERKLVRKGNLEFGTDNVEETKKEIEKISTQYKAYTSSESQHRYNNQLRYVQEIRIPAEDFDVVVKRIEALASSVESKNINVEDVTEEFIDVEARLATKKALEERYRSLLAQAKTVADMVSIENQIGSVRSEIDSMQGA